MIRVINRVLYNCAHMCASGITLPANARSNSMSLLLGTAGKKIQYSIEKSHKIYFTVNSRPQEKRFLFSTSGNKPDFEIPFFQNLKVQIGREQGQKNSLRYLKIDPKFH